MVLRKNKFLSDFNISIIKITKNAINVRTSEHGAGETLACGSQQQVLVLHMAKMMPKQL